MRNLDKIADALTRDCREADKVLLYTGDLKRIAMDLREVVSEQELESFEPIREYCREELGEDHNFTRCNAPAEFLLWGKLIPKEGLGPRCYNHAAKHVGHHALVRNSGYALLDLRNVYVKGA